MSIIVITKIENSYIIKITIMMGYNMDSEETKFVSSPKLKLLSRRTVGSSTTHSLK